MTLNLNRTNWNRVKLGDLAVASKEKVDPLSGEVDRYIAGDHMDTDSLKLHRWGEVGDGYLGPAFHRRFHPGQVLYGSRRTYLRKVAVAQFGGVTANTTFVVETKNSSQLLQEFLPFVMTSEPFHAFSIQESKGSVNPYVNWSDLERFEFCLPPLDEQKRIADLFWAIERTRVEVVSALEAAKKLLTSVRAAMFNQQEGARSVTEAFEITIGRQRSPKHQSGAHIVYYLRSANVTLGGIDVSDIKRMNFEPKAQEKYALQPGDVLVTEASASTSSVGLPAVWRKELSGIVCFQNTLLRYRAIEGVTLSAFVEQFCHWAFESGQFLAVASGTNIRHIGVGGATSMRLRIPSLEEQRAFIDQTSKVNQVVDALASEESTLRTLALSLSKEIFGGR